MLAVVGYLVVAAAVFGGFVLAGGHVAALIQPYEFIIIFGAALGAFFIANPPRVLFSVLSGFPRVFQQSRFNKALYMELLSLMFELLQKVRREGLMAIESDVETPDTSAVFSKYTLVMRDKHLMEFLTDFLRMMVGGNLNAFEIESLMDTRIATHHNEGGKPIHAIERMADGLPAFGIVACVLGVVHTMESVGIPPAELGRLIAAALVGTFLGILLSYGFIGPLATALEHKLDESGKALECIKEVLLASMNGYAPQVAVEFGRSVLYSHDQPSFIELEEHLKNQRHKT